jgi:alkanesulfonate monooxygenase SsuD/methylene tetrahydromethanopterin reductase-like flavin-dependent oxidoreductase (luciferase family)
MSSPILEIGLLLHTRHLLREGESLSQVGELWETAAFADETGFDHLWVGDSPRLSMQDRAHAECMTILAALAARTRKIRIGMVPLILALRNPVLTAHSLATLDVISGGRTIVGVSAGHHYQFAQREFEACGVPYHQRAGRLNESIHLLRRLWTEASFAFVGKYYRFEVLGIVPRPIQRPIPIWITAGDNESALRRVARLGELVHRSPWFQGIFCTAAKDPRVGRGIWTRRQENTLYPLRHVSSQYEWRGCGEGRMELGRTLFPPATL